MKIRKLTFTKNGQRQTTRKFYGVFSDFSQTMRKIALLDNRKAAQELARKIDQLNSLRAAGEPMPPELARYVETMPPAICKKLIAWEILGVAHAAAGKPLVEHLEDWKQSLLDAGRRSDYAALAMARAKRAFGDGGFVHWSDIRASRLMETLASYRVAIEGGREIGAQTFNFYLQAVKQFCRWMVRERRATESRVAHLQGLNVKIDRRHDRRAFSLEEMRFLLTVTGGGPVRALMTGSERALLYRLAAETGLRRGALAAFTRASFSLDIEHPYVTVPAGAPNKYRAERQVPLRKDTAALLARHLANKLPATLAFKIPAAGHSAKMVRDDLADARAKWLEEASSLQEREVREGTDFLRYQDSAGRFLDFHALRHTRGVWLFEYYKAHPREVQELMGLSSLTLVDRYTRSFRLNSPELIERGPDLSTPAGSEKNKSRKGG